MTSVVAVVDDDPRVLESLENLLASAGYEVHLFPTAPALLRHSAFARIDCLISDVGMPDVDGYELQRLAHLARPELPVLLITGQAFLDDAIAVRKPFNGRELLAAVAKAVGAGSS